MLDYSAVLSRQEDLEAERRLEESEWDEIARLMRPDQVGISSGDNKRKPAYDDLFDGTQLYALEAFAGGMFTQATNPMDQWFGLSTGDQDLDKWGSVKRWLYSTTSRLSASLSPAVSCFYAEAPAWFWDVGTFGFSVMNTEEDIGNQRIIDRVLPIGQCYLDVDAFGMVDTMHRKFRLKGRQVRQMFAGGAPSDLDDQRSYEIIHGVTRNLDFQPRRLGPEGKRFVSLYCSPDIKGWQRAGGYEEFPFFVPQWNRRPGRAYPTGPGHVVKPDSAMLQEMERSHIVAAQYAAEPPVLVNDESVLTAADIVPNALLYGTMNDQGKKLMEHLSRGNDVRLSMQQSEQRRNAVREGFYFGLMQLVNRPQMTATEFLGFQEEKLRLMGPNLVRIQTYGLSPFIARRYRILSRAGQIDPLPPELQGRMLSIEYVSPLAKAMKAGLGRATLQWLQAVGELAQIDPTAMDNVDIDGSAAVLHDAYGAAPQALRDPKTVTELRQARQGQVAQQQALDQTGQAVTIAAEAAHAAQAATLSGQRAGKGGKQ